MVESVEKSGTCCTLMLVMKTKLVQTWNLEAQSMGMEDNIFRVVVPEEEAHEVKKWERQS